MSSLAGFINFAFSWEKLRQENVDPTKSNEDQRKPCRNPFQELSLGVLLY